MDRNEFRQALDTLKLTQRDLARMLQVSPRTVNLWISGENALPGYAISYLDLYQRHQALISYLEEHHKEKRNAKDSQ